MTTHRIEREGEMEDRLLAMPERDSAVAILPDLLSKDASRQLLRMFRDPRVLEANERRALIAQLRNAVELSPDLAEIRVLLGMALSVDLQAEEALDQLRRAAEQAPDCFIARLKHGELLMRLRICGKAAEETQQAARLAVNAAQSELARRQAETIRTMMREGIERGGYAGLLLRFFRSHREHKEQNSTPAYAGTK